MTTSRSFESAFEMVDYTEELLLVPNTWGLVNELGIFSSEGISQHSITVESNEGTLGLITDQVRGARALANKDDTRILRSFPIPHYPVDDSISPSDVQGKRAYGQADAAETTAAVIQRKIERMRRNHAVTMEFARCYALTNGAIWAPNGTVAANYYTDFGVTRKEVAFDLANATTNVIEKGEEIIAHIQDNIMSGESVNEVIGLASPEFFALLIKQAGVTDAYKYYTSTQEPNRARLGSGLYRQFEHGGIRYIEYRGSYNGTKLIPANECYFVPMGTQDSFVSYFSPANKFEHVNTNGEEAYMWTYTDPKGSKIEVESESNAIHLLRRPQAVCRATSAASF